MSLRSTHQLPPSETQTRLLILLRGAGGGQTQSRSSVSDPDAPSTAPSREHASAYL